MKLEKGVEGLIHISKIPPGTKLKIGDKIKVYIEKLDTKRRKLSLLLEQTKKPVTYR